jgi:Zn-dependent protease with chaperone function
MIGAALLTLPLAALVGYGLLEARRARLVGLSIAALALATLLLAWVPGLAAGAAATLTLGTASDLVLLSWIGLTSLVLLNLHLKLRRQMHVVTALARQIALAGEQPVAGINAPAMAASATPVTATSPLASPAMAELETIVEIRPLAPRPAGAATPAFADAPPDGKGHADDDELGDEPVPSEPAAGGARR